MSKVPQLSDIELIERLKISGESGYFSILYRRYGGKVFAKSLTMLQDHDWAQDATQEIFTKVYLNLSKFNERSKFSTWLYSITYNYCIDVIRKRKKLRNVFSDEIEKLPEIVDDTPDEFLLQMEVERLKTVLDDIPVGDKAVLLMKYQDDMSIKDIAEVLDKSESAIKMKILRAKEKAAQAYKNIYNEYPIIA